MNNLFAQFTLDFEIKLFEYDTFKSITSDNPHFYYIEIEYKDGTPKKILKYDDLVKTGLNSILSNCENIKKAEIHVVPHISNRIVYKPIPILCNFLPEPREWTLVSNAAKIKSKKSTFGWGPIENEFIIGDPPSDEFKEYFDRLTWKIGLNQLNVKLYKTEDVQTFAESLSIKHDENGRPMLIVEIFYNEMYFQEMKKKAKETELNLILLHELGHFIVSHLNGRSAELEADYFSGRWMFMHYRNGLDRGEILDIAQNIYSQVPENEFYPDTEERIKSFIAGWDDGFELNENENTEILHFINNIQNTYFKDDFEKGIRKLDSLQRQTISNNRVKDEIFKLQFNLSTKIIARDNLDGPSKYRFYQKSVTALGNRENLEISDKTELLLDKINLEYIYNGTIPPLGLETYSAILEEGVLNNQQKGKINYLLGLENFSKNTGESLELASSQFSEAISLDNSNSLYFFWFGKTLFKIDSIANWNQALVEILKYKEINQLSGIQNITRKEFIQELTPIMKVGLNDHFKNEKYTEFLLLLEKFVDNSLTFNPDLIFKRIYSNIKVGNYDRVVTDMDMFFPANHDQNNIKILKNLADESLSTLLERNDPIYPILRERFYNNGLVSRN